VPSESLPTVELIPPARGGDAEALQALLRRSQEFVRLVVRARCPGQLRARLESCDIVQEVLLRAARGIGQFEGSREEEWRAWLARVAEHEVIHQARFHLGAARRALSREQPLPAGPESSANGVSRLGVWFAAAQTSPSQVAVRNERALLLADALARLPEDHREVLVLRHLEGLAFLEVAERLGRSAGAVRVLWTRALKKLREELGQEDVS